jgi:hypothetical protein
MNIQTAAATLLVLLLSYGRPLLADGAAVWFGPNDDLLRPWKPEQLGPADFMELFSPEAPWSTAASRVSYLQSNLFGIDQRSDAELDQMIASLRARNIRFAIEDGGLEYDPACGAPVEGDISFATTQRILQRFKQRGGVVDAFIVDQPFWAGSFNPQGCQRSPEDTGRRLATFAKQLRTVYPDIQVGTVDIYLAWPLIDPEGVAYQVFLDSYRLEFGAELAFFHADVPAPTEPGWYETLALVHAIARERGISFGIIYNGSGGDGSPDSTDAIWLEQAWQKMLAYELRAPVQPDHAILESWMQHPTHVLPETSPTAHTNLILRYTRPRTYLEVQVEPNQVQGRLVDSADTPVANVPVQLIGKPLDGPGIGYTYARAGTVPAEATTAVLALRVNAECRDCQAPVTLQISGAGYTEGEANRVQNPDFSAGLSDWGLSGTAQVSASGGGLSLRAAATQQAMLNSAPFPVTGAAAYSMQFDATVAPQSFSGGYFAVIFLGPSGEILREQLPFEATLEAGSALTDSQGRVTLNIPDTGETSMTWSLHFAGNEQLWPSRER